MIDAPIHPAEQFRAFLEQGRFMLQRARGSGAHVFYPRVAEPRTGATDLDWVEASGRGVVYSVTVQRNRPPAPDASLALVDLAEGPRMLTRIDGIAPDEVTIGMAVRARIVDEGGGPFVVFEPDSAA
ncbi:hypothetical protein DFR49_3027 [Hephaestia caeni]|uniref:ChsH2 C-terminal OB-fold domain-containing protein n=1 Tax=Hephaestia caeni TaxID=645617 RepID=A0A397NI21_9SPHN|nr:OB-fold domain-containing protein [Hephaestia caeni]RIA37150.1 hypothetical protein DFR49_3027 [Hephaestia caeni]